MQQCDHAAVKRRACANQLSFRYRAAISGNLKENKKKKQNKTKHQKNTGFKTQFAKNK